MAWVLFTLAARFLMEGWIINGIWGGEVKEDGRRVAYWIVQPNGGEQ